MLRVSEHYNSNVSSGSSKSLGMSRDDRETVEVKGLGNAYLEGHGDLVSWFIMGIVGVIIWLIGVINYKPIY